MRYYALNDYLQDTFGEKVYKIALNGGFTCPNRDGTLDTRGCIFCSGAGSGEFAGRSEDSITAQIEQGKERIKKKIKNGKYIAYFQAFTNTYAPVQRLRALYEEAVSHPDIAVLSVATRPDCLSQEVVALLQEMNRRKPVWVELGLQTIHEKTAEYIRRGYPLSVYDGAVKALKEIGVQVIVHVILGLPGETRKQMIETVRHVGDLGIFGIKLQLLHVLSDTDLGALYRESPFPLLSQDEYCELIADCIERLPENITIHRLTGDGPKDLLVAPLWSRAKRSVLNQIEQTLKKRDTWQGKYAETDHLTSL